jgi:hypothetical protein
MSKIFRNGDKVTMLSYRLPQLNNNFGNQEIFKHSNLEVTQAGKLSFTVTVNNGKRRHKQDNIGQSVEGIFNNSYCLFVPIDGNVDEYISLIKEKIKSNVSDLLKKSQELVSHYENALTEDILVNENVH